MVGTLFCADAVMALAEIRAPIAAAMVASLGIGVDGSFCWFGSAALGRVGLAVRLLHAAPPVRCALRWHRRALPLLLRLLGLLPAGLRALLLPIRLLRLPVLRRLRLLLLPLPLRLRGGLHRRTLRLRLSRCGGYLSGLRRQR